MSFIERQVTALIYFGQEFDSLLSHLSRKNSNAFIAGDYNIDLLKVTAQTPTRIFLNSLASNRFLLMILRRKTTRPRGTAYSLIIFFTNTSFECTDSTMIRNVLFCTLD